MKSPVLHFQSWLIPELLRILFEILHYFKILVPGGGIEPPQKTVRDSPILNIFVIG